jgi:hypothetical protein
VNPGGIVSTSKERGESIVPDAAGRRLSNQIARAYRGTYGATTGLKTVLRSVSLQMLRAGASPEIVSRALTAYVVNCPTPIAVDARHAINDAYETNALVSLTTDCVLDAATEMSRPGNDTLGPIGDGRAAYAIPVFG